MSTKTTFNLFSNFDEMSTEANTEIIKNSIRITSKNNFNQNLANSKNIRWNFN